jgi:N-acetylglucosaminyl-diphospho-decaprenol L-rhamnosyltransferase
VPDTPPQVSVIIVTHDSLPVLAGCLQALVRAIATTSCEIVMVDNASRDLTVEVVQRLVPSAGIIPNDRNLGFAHACNQGANVASGDFLLFLNPDVELDSDAIATLLVVMKDHLDAGLVSGRLRNTDGTFQATCRRFPTIGNMIFSRGSALVRLFSKKSSSGARYTLPDSPETTEVPSVAATMVMVRRPVFAKSGGFDRRFFMFLEDTDLSLRLHQLGYRNLFVPSAGGVHHWGKGAKAGRVRREYYHHVSMWKYFLKHVPNGFSVVVLPLLLLVNLLFLILLPARGARSGDR